MRNITAIGNSLCVFCIAAAAIFCGCGNELIGNPVPPELASEAEIGGFPGVRAWGDQPSGVFQSDLVESIRQARRHGPTGIVDGDGMVNILALSGGGDDGAFGAGLLAGWSAAGTRPPFKLVTGISTGALMAPFAFLGPQYDANLEAFYTGVTDKDTLRAKPLLSLLGATDSLTDTAPLARLLEKTVTDEIIEAVAEAHRQGQRLYIGTTNLDALRLVIWNMGAIAASGRPDAPDLFRKIMLASASIPAAFPPVHFPVDVGGKAYDEMHLDGGVSTEVFFYGVMLDLDAAIREAGIDEEHRARLYIVRDSQLRADHAIVLPRPLPIAGLIAYQGIGDLYRHHAVTTRDGIGFNVAAIPSDYVPAGQGGFDPVEMRRLLDLGFDMACKGYPWDTGPSGLSVQDRGGPWGLPR